MSWKSTFDTDGSSKKMGDAGEDNFKKEAEKRGCSPVKTPSEVDRKQHVDWYLTILSKRTTCDSKAHKALFRGGEPQDEWILLEKKNVRGDKGWLYWDAEYISFEQSDKFILVPRAELINLWNNLVDETMIVKRASDAKGVLYQREGRLDLISYVKNTDVMKLPGVIIWEKSKDV